MNTKKVRDILLAGLMLGAALLGAAPVKADYQVIDGTAHLIPFKSFACTTGFGTGVCPGHVPIDPTGAAFGVSGNPFYVAPVQDARPSAGSITVIDSGSTTSSGQNGVTIVAGTPTGGSVYTQAINGQAIARIQLSGTWTGTAAIEGSVDNGVTWVAQPARVSGTSFTGSSATLNGLFMVDTSGLSNLRVRATAAMTGSLTALMTFAANPGVVQIVNPLRLFDNASGQQATIKPASTAPLATDPAMVVALSPNGGGGGLSVVDQSAFTQGTSAFTPSGGVFNDAATLTTGQEGTYRLTTKRAQLIDTDTTGNALYTAVTQTVTPPSTVPTAAANAADVVMFRPDSPGLNALGPNTAALSVPGVSTSQYPVNSVTTTPTPLVAKGTGSTGAVTGTLTPAATATAYVCGFVVSYVGGTAQVGPLVLSGLLGGSFTFQIPLSTATGGNNFSQTFTPCIPASAVNTAIVLTTIADGTATAVDVNIWGYGL